LKKIKMDTFFGENTEIDNSGTNDDPILLGWIFFRFLFGAKIT